MKHNQLYNELTKAGCFITRHGAEHDEWFNPQEWDENQNSKTW
ncbi:hypothetical protein [Segatella copri]|nr:hypothetical protein [Segatella copri]